MLTPQEEAELAALEQEFAPVQKQVNASQSATSRNPQALENVSMSGLSPSEEMELSALEQEFSGREIVNPQIESKSLITQVGELYDQYSGSAPLRSAVGSFIDNGSIKQSLGTFSNQYGADPNQAPTGMELAQKMGLSDETLPGQIQISDAQKERQAKLGGNYGPTPQGGSLSQASVAGFGLDVALDPLNLIPFALVGKVAGKGAKYALKGSAAAAEAAIGGTKVYKAGEFIADTGKMGVDSIVKARKHVEHLFNPKVLPDFDKSREVLQANGIATEYIPESIIYGKNSVASRAARADAEGFVNDDLLKFEKFQGDVSRATESKISKISDSGIIPNNHDAGQLIKDGLDDGFKEFMSGMDITYNNAIKSAPGIKLDKVSSAILNRDLNKLELWAKKRLGDTRPYEKVLNNPNSTNKQLKIATNDMFTVLDSTNQAIRPAGKAQAKEVLEAVRLAKQSMINSGGDLAQVHSIMRDIGEIAFDTKSVMSETPADIAKFQDMYFSGQRAMTETIRSHFGDTYADALLENNKAMSKTFSNRSKLSKVIGKGENNAQVFESLMLRGSKEQIEALKASIPDSKWKKLKAAYIDKQIVRDADGFINFTASRKKLNTNKEHIGYLFDLRNGELDELNDIVSVGDKAGIGVLSTSGTGGSQKFSDIIGTIQNKLTSDTIVSRLKRNAEKAYQAEKGIKLSGEALPVDEIIMPKKSAYQLLSERNPATKKQAAQAAKLESIQERNEKIRKMRKLRGY
jgi:hypothetical protein